MYFLWPAQGLVPSTWTHVTFWAVAEATDTMDGFRFQAWTVDVVLVM